MRYFKLFKELDGKARERATSETLRRYENIYKADAETIADDWQLVYDGDGKLIGEYRICSECGEPMVCGYCFDGGTKYYCSDECLAHDFTDAEWIAEVNENGDSYWTEWV